MPGLVRQSFLSQRKPSVFTILLAPSAKRVPEEISSHLQLLARRSPVLHGRSVPSGTPLRVRRRYAFERPDCLCPAGVFGKHTQAPPSYWREWTGRIAASRSCCRRWQWTNTYAEWPNSKGASVARYAVALWPIPGDDKDFTIVTSICETRPNEPTGFRHV